MAPDAVCRVPIRVDTSETLVVLVITYRFELDRWRGDNVSKQQQYTRTSLVDRPYGLLL